MRTFSFNNIFRHTISAVGMKPLSERDENSSVIFVIRNINELVGMKPLSERDENYQPDGCII